MSKQTGCTCSICRKMCQTAPCIGTPAEMLAIAKAGFKDGLAPTLWGVGKVLGICEPIPIVAPLMTDKGCAFYRNGLCVLHDLGLKPSEGKNATCVPPKNRAEAVEIFGDILAIARSWQKDEHTEDAIKVMRMLL